MSTQETQAYIETKELASCHEERKCEFLSLEDCIAVSMPLSGSQEGLEKALVKYVQALKAFALSTSEYVGALDGRGQLSSQFLSLVQALKRWRGAASLKLGVELDEVAVTALFWERVTKIRTPMGGDLLGRALTLSQRMQTTVELDQRDLPGSLMDLAKLCAALQAINPEKDSFYLSCREAGRLLKVDYRAANTYLGALVGMGVLREVVKGRKTPEAQYQFILPIPSVKDAR
jgi:hypothetical protein